MKERRYDADWLRIFAILSVFIYHCSRFFDTEGWHIKNVQQSEILFILMRGLIWPWVMELFFVLSGLGAWYSLQHSTSGEFLIQRVKRLLIPFYTVGLLFLLPIQLYFELITNASYQGSFWQFLPQYFSRIGTENVSRISFSRFISHPENFLPIPFSGHLWFIQYLFLVSILALPLLLYLKSKQGISYVNKLAEWSCKPGGIFLFAIPLSIVLIMLRGLFDASRGWADLLWYLIYFIVGYMIPAENRFTESIKRHNWICLGAWIMSFFGILLLVIVFGYSPVPGKGYFSTEYILFQILWSIMSLSSVVFVLGIGAKYLKYSNKILDYGNEAVLPFYLFHQTIILCVGWLIIPLNIGIMLKLTIIALISFPMIMILYELFVRRFRILRFFFGMNSKRKSSIALMLSNS